MMPGRHRGFRLVSLLVARTPGTRPYRAINAAGLREALVKRQKNDAADAEAICEAVTRATMRFELIDADVSTHRNRTRGFP